jgi:outer membrane lipoprotein-sorting protein
MMNTYRRIAAWTALVALLAIAAPAFAGEDAPSVDEIVRKSNHVAYYQGDDGRSHVKMTITDEGGGTRNREFVILRKDVADGGEQKFYVYFERPADVRKMVYMVWKHIGRDDDRWLYLPALDLVKRIAASDERTSFAGSHFYYEDVSGRGIEEDKHELVETTEEHYVLKNTPKDPDAVEFSSYTLWIDKKTFMPMKGEYLDKQGKKYRVVEALEVKEIEGFPTVVKSKVQDIKSGGHTVSEFSGIDYNIDLPDDVFTERYLRRAPRRWLR